MYVLLNLCLFGMNLPWALEIADINCDKFARDGSCIFTRHLISFCVYFVPQRDIGDERAPNCGDTLVASQASANRGN